MHYVILFLNLAFVAFMVFYLAVMGFSLLSTRYHLRKTAKKIARMNLASRSLTAEETAACKKLYPRLANRIPADARVITIAGGYGYTTISGKYGTESRMQHAIGPLPFHFLQCMESSLSEEEENTAELILLSNGTAIPVSINDTWTVQQEAAAREALEQGHIAVASSGGSKLSDRNDSPSVREYRMYHPPLRITASVILLVGIILMLAWNRELPAFLLYAGTALASFSLIWILVPGSGKAAKKTGLIMLSGTAVFRGTRVMVDRYLLQVLPKGAAVLEDGKKVMLEGWVHPKNQVTFYTTAIRDTYGETLWSLEKNHLSRNWMRFLIPLILTTVSILMYASVNYSFSIAKDYLNWKEHGQTEQTFESVEQLAEIIERPESLPPGSIINLENFAIVEDPSRPGAEYAYRVMEKRLKETPDFSEARTRAARLARLIRTPLGTSIFVGTNYPERRLRYISLFIDQFTSDESPADFADTFSDSVHFTSFLEAAEDYEAIPGNSGIDMLLHSWTAFLREETDAINELIADEFFRALLNQPGVSITSDYNTPEGYYPFPAPYLKQRHFDPYQIPLTSTRSFTSTPQESWIAETPGFEKALNELERLQAGFPYVAGNSQTALVTGTSTSRDGDPVLELTFSLYRVERALAERETLKILLALAAVSVILAAGLAGHLLREVITHVRASQD